MKILQMHNFFDIPPHICYNKLNQFQKNIKVPEQMILFSRMDLVNLFQNNGMKVIYSCSLKIPEEGDSEWKTFENENYDNPSAVVGIIAEKY